MSFNANLDHVESLVRAGANADALAHLKRVALGEGSGKGRRRLSGAALARLANLARRCGDRALALRFLMPILRRDGNFTASAAPGELAEYAACLYSLGASEQSLKVLSKVEARAYPMKVLYEGFAQVTLRDYAAASLSFRCFLDEFCNDPYFERVAKSNLLAALIEESDYDGALTLAEALEPELAAGSKYQLLFSVLDLKCQAYGRRGNGARASVELERLRALASTHLQLRPVQSLQLTRLEIDADFRRGRKRSAMARLNDAQKRAREVGGWEMLREFEFQQCELAPREAAIARLCLGTPYPAFRRKVERRFGVRATDLAARTEHLEFVYLSPHAGPSAIVVDAEGGSVHRGRARLELKPGQSLHRLLRGLVDDLYKPPTLAGLWSHVMPDGVYHPIYSYKSLFELIRRLRAGLLDAKTRVQISKRGETLWFESPLGVRREFTIAPAAADASMTGLSERARLVLRTPFDRVFSLAEFAKRFDLPGRSAARLLAELVASRVVLRHGSRRGARYEFAKNL